MTGSPLPSQDSPDMRNRLGQRLRQVRQDQNLTLAQVAERSGVSIGTLSKVERGMTSLGYDRFSQLADSLQIDIGELFAEGARIQDDLVIKASEGQVVRHVTDNYDLEMMFSEVYGKTMVPVLCTLRADNPQDLSTYIRHKGQEFVHVLSGQVVLLFERHPPLTLNTGESAYFDSAQGHLYTAGGQQDARVIVVCAGPDEATGQYSQQG